MKKLILIALIILSSCQKEENVKPSNLSEKSGINDQEKANYRYEVGGKRTANYLKMVFISNENNQVYGEGYVNGFRHFENNLWKYEWEQFGTRFLEISATAIYTLETPEDSLFVRIYRNDSLLAEDKGFEAVSLSGIF